MTTARDIFKRSLRLLNVYAEGEDPTTDEATDGLRALNALVDSYSNSLMVYQRAADAIPLSINQQTVTVGPSGAFITARPTEVLNSSYVTLNGVDFPLAILTEADYNSIPVKTIAGIPSGICPLMGMPNITIQIWPVPAAAATLNLWSNKQAATAFADLSTDYQLPKGYERALAFMLAEEIAPEYEREPSPAVLRQAGNARRQLKRTNVMVPRLQVPYGVSPQPFTNWRAS